MAKELVSKETNRDNLFYFSEFLRRHDIESFVFFGTLLGLIREHDVLENDDDVDFYVNARHRDQLLKLLTQEGFELNLGESPNHSAHFLQISRTHDSQVGAVDFYFYEHHETGFIIERWNFTTHFEDPSSALHIPSSMIFPIREIGLHDQQIQVPHEAEAVVAWLYGERWRTPLSKSVDYLVLIRNNQPKLVKRMPRKFERFIPKFMRAKVRDLVFRD